MRICRIELDEDESVDLVTVIMSARELAYIAKITGKQTGESSNAFVGATWGNAANTSVYEALTGGVINRFYENGTDEMIQELSE